MADQDTGLLPGEKAPVIVAPIHAAPKTPAEAAKGQSTTTMEFPKPVHLTVSPNHSIFFPAGVHEVADHLVDHWYLEAHGARVYSRPVASGKADAKKVAKPPKRDIGAPGGGPTPPPPGKAPVEDATTDAEQDRRDRRDRN